MAHNNTLDDDDSDFDRRSNYDADSDDESLINVDSPADGYFTHRDHPRAAFVENPARTSEDKAREAAEERQLSRSVPAAAGIQPTDATRQPAGFDDSAPLLDAGPAPPDYYQATAGRGAPPSPFARGHTRETSYGSISTPPRSRGRGQARDSLDEGFAGRNLPAQSEASFGSDHPLVRNGLFNEQGVLDSRRSEPQSMRDQERGQPQPPPAGTTQTQRQVTPPPIESNTPRRSVDTDEESGSEPLPHYRHHHHYHEHHHDYKKQQKRWRRFCYCCCVPRMGCLNIFLIIALIVMLVMFTRRSHNSSGNKPDYKIPVTTPGTPSPPDDSKISIPDHPNTRQCNFDSTSTDEYFDFHDPDNFSFLEMIDSSTFSHLAPAGARIGGRIRIAPFPESASSGNGATDDDVAIRVWVRIAVTKPWSVKDLRFALDEDGFELGFPDVSISSDLFGEQGWERPCVDFAVLIQVRKDVEIQNWDLTTANLDVEVTNGIFPEYSDAWAEFLDDDSKTELMLEKEKSGLSITNETSMYAVRGKIEVAYWSSRRIRISTTSGSISGTYALRDSLEVESQSGSIDVGVEPKKADKDDPSDAPADFVVKSTSGSVNVECPARHDEQQGLIPERQYRTRVETTSSTINGRFLLGVSTSFSSYSGTIDASVWPLSANKWKSSLSTSTTSSTTSLTLLEALSAIPFVSGAGSINPLPPHNSRWEMGSIKSSHKSTSGTISLRYPSHWSGAIEGRSVSGSIDVRGKDVEIISDEHGPGFSKLKAKKGSGKSKLTFKTLSSSVDIVVGET